MYKTAHKLLVGAIVALCPAVALTVSECNEAVVISVRPCSPSAVKEVFKIAEEVRLENLADPPVERTERGFLISNYSLHEYEHFAQQGYLLCARDSGNVVGFLVLCPWTSQSTASLRTRLSSSSDWKIAPEIEEQLLWMDQIAVSPSTSKQGVASAMVSEVKRKHAQKYIASAVAEKPFSNTASIKFHLANGFRRVGTFQSEKFAGIENYQSGIFLFSPMDSEK